MRGILLGIVGLALLAMPVSAQTADEIIAKYIKTIGGAEKIEPFAALLLIGDELSLRFERLCAIR